ncbi:MAG: Calx-beta domain-containing protein [Isosphaeraceae bacterium]
MLRPFVLLAGLTGGVAIGALAAATVTITNDDIAGVDVTPVLGLSTTEAGGTASIKVKLRTQPSANVTINLASDNPSEGTLDKTSLTFTPADWNVDQTVTITGVDDLIDDGNVAYTIVLSPAVSTDAYYNGLDPTDVAVTNTNNDTASILVSPTSGLVTTEAGGTASFQVRLASQPTAPVTIGLTSSRPTEGTIDRASLTFTAANWNVDQTVTITGVDDFIDDDNVAYTIVTAAATSADAKYNGKDGADVSVTNNDDDTAFIRVTPTSGLSTTEAGGTAQFTVQLDSQPTANVTIGLGSSKPTEGTPSASSLVFTPANWNVKQTVTITGVNDFVDDGDVAYTIVTAAATSSDAKYSGRNADDVAVVNVDDDVAGYTFSRTSGLVTTEAGGTDTFTVRLTSQPASNVTISFASSDPTEGTVAPASVTFTTANWATPRLVTLTGVNDSIVDGSIVYTIVTTVTSTDAQYAAIDPPDVSATNSDDDSAGVSVTSATALTTAESGTSVTLRVRLNTQPTADVTIPVSSSDLTEGTVDRSSLTFTPANWNVEQLIVVTGVDDPIDDGDAAYSVILGAITSGDAGYAGINPSDVNLVNTNDDHAGIVVTPQTGLLTSEAGLAASFTVRLNAQPTADVTIAIHSSNTAEGMTDKASLTFTPANWATPQTVTITGVDDFVKDGDVAYTIVTDPAASADAAYQGLNPSDVAVVNADNDTPGVVFTPNTGLVTTEAGGKATFQVRLNTQPTADVSFNLSSTNNAEGILSTTTLTFTPGNWNVGQVVTITGVDDGIDDGDAPYLIVTSPATSADASYNGFNPIDLSVVNVDDDTAGLIVSPTTGLVTTEAGGAVVVTVRLALAPTANVTIPVSSSKPTEGRTSVALLTFTPANWNVAQTITLTGVDDLIDDGDTPYQLVLGALSSADTGYNGYDPADLAVVNLDDDAAGVFVAPTSGLVTSEAGGITGFAVKLTSQPLAPVSIALASNRPTEGTLSTSTLIFTPQNWATPQVVLIFGVNDNVNDGDTPYVIVTSPAVSTDPRYNGVDAADVNVVNKKLDLPPPVTVTSVRLVTARVGRQNVTTVVLTFSDAIDSTRAQQLANYKLAAAGRDRRYDTRDDVITRFRSASYNATARTVTLTPVNRTIALTSPLQLRVIAGGLTDTLGRALDGNHDGAPGGDATAIVSRGGVRINRLATSTPSGPVAAFLRRAR